MTGVAPVCLAVCLGAVFLSSCGAPHGPSPGANGVVVLYRQREKERERQRQLAKREREIPLEVFVIKCSV